jgi:RNA polymerase sigma factor (sigma-70 family)
MIRSISGWSDIELIEGIKDGNEIALENLYRLDREGVINYVTNNKGSYDDGADIYQEGIIVVWNKIKTGKYIKQDNAQLKTYLNRVCRNLWYKKLRYQGKLTSMPDDYEAEDGETFDYSDNERKLEACFSVLREKCQKVLRLRFWEKKSLEEIAKILGNTINVIKNDSSDCIKSLREQFKKKK